MGADLVGFDAIYALCRAKAMGVDPRNVFRTDAFLRLNGGRFQEVVVFVAILRNNGNEDIRV